MDQSEQTGILAAICWLSVIVLTWLLALDRLELGLVSGAAWVFFFATAVVSSALASGRKA